MLYRNFATWQEIDGELIQRESLLFNIPASAPPLCADVGGDESAEFRRQSADYLKAWQAAGLRGTYTEQQGKNHFSVISDFAVADSTLCEKLIAFILDCEQ